MEKKFTDEQIIKALECCIHSDCEKCPINRKEEIISNQDEMIRGLINAQETLQKEIKKLKKGHILYDGEV